jgi:hypothetical protein
MVQRTTRKLVFSFSSHGMAKTREIEPSTFKCRKCDLSNIIPLSFLYISTYGLLTMFVLERYNDLSTLLKSQWQEINILGEATKPLFREIGKAQEHWIGKPLL